MEQSRWVGRSRRVDCWAFGSGGLAGWCLVGVIVLALGGDRSSRGALSGVLVGRVPSGRRGQCAVGCFEENMTDDIDNASTSELGGEG